MKLFDIELRFRRLKENLRKPSSDRYKLLSISSFLDLLKPEENYNKYYSFFLELEPVLTNLIYKNNLSYFSPDELDSLIKNLKSFQKFEIFIKQEQKFEKLNDILEKAKSEILTILCEQDDDHYKVPQILSMNSANVVFVEMNSDNNREKEQCYGMIQKLHLDTRKNDKRNDTIEFRNVIDPNESEIKEQLNKVVNVVKEKNKSIIPKKRNYNFVYYFEEEDYIYYGSSLCLPAACLAHNQILINEMSENYYKFWNDTVFSGEIDKDGNLLPIDSGSLKTKLETIFYSPFSKFVLPQYNFFEAERELEKLNKIYPKRKLLLIPIRNYEDVFKNLDIVEKYKLRLKDKIIANYKRYHVAVNWFLSMAALIIIAFFIVNYLIPVLDRNPVIPRLENKKFTAYNKYGIKVWESDFNAHDHQGSLLHEDHYIKNNMQISDLDNDNKNEIVVLNPYFEDYVNRRSIFCYQSDNTLLWQYSKVPEEIYYGGNLFDDNYWIQNVKVFDFNKDGKKEIVTFGYLDPWFPCRITLYDYKGNEINHYWNAGHLNEIDTYDLDGDGKDEIYLMGLTNDPRYWCAILVVLDPDFVEGASFNTDPHRDGKPGLEKYYIIFPKTVLTDFCPSHHINAREILTKGKDNISVVVCDGAAEIYYDVKKSFLVYEFDKNMNVKSVGWSSSFRSEYNDLVKERKLEPIKDVAAYNDSLKNAVLYWDGDKFVNHTTMNKHYLAAKDSVMKIKDILH